MTAKKLLVAQQMCIDFLIPKNCFTCSRNSE